MNQGSGLEVFAAITEDMRRLAASRSGSLTVETKDAAYALLLDEIAKHDSIYVSQEEAHKSIDLAARNIEVEPIANALVAKLYSKKVTKAGKLGAHPE